MRYDRHFKKTVFISFLTIAFAYKTVYALPDEFTARRIMAGAKIFRALLASDADIESKTGKPFFQGIDLSIDYDVISAAPGSQDLQRGNTAFRDCFLSEVALYSPNSDELTGIARFRVSDFFFKRLRMDVKRTLYYFLIVLRSCAKIAKF